METRIADLVKGRYPVFQLEPFSTTALARGPILFIGTFTAVDKDGRNVAERDWYRICLALVDLRSGKIVSKGFARAAMAGVDVTPTAVFRDAPAWAPDPATQGYVRTCQGTKVGDPINPIYWDRIIAAAMINDASMAYTAGRYEEALDLYKGVQRTKGGDQLRVYNGVYLAAARLGRQTEATQAFGNLVDFGLAQNQLGVKFLFRPGSTLFVPDPKISGAYQMWLKQISDRAGRRTSCMTITGHTSKTGPEPLNERLSLLRAQYVKQQLDKDNPPLARRTSTAGVGSRENISGLGTDDARDALDRRVEFKVKGC
jgi:outer membrane protein OmpA-like peptidoglycan-associated protein